MTRTPLLWRPGLVKLPSWTFPTCFWVIFLCARFPLQGNWAITYQLSQILSLHSVAVEGSGLRSVLRLGLRHQRGGDPRTHTHRDIPGNVAEEALGERLTAERCRQSIRERGRILTAVCSSGQRHRKATHFVFAGGEYLLVQVQ